MTRLDISYFSMLDEMIDAGKNYKLLLKSLGELFRKNQTFIWWQSSIVRLPSGHKEEKQKNQRVVTSFQWPNRK